MDTLKEDVLAVINNNKIGAMATLSGEKPYGRYMTFTNEQFTLYTTTEGDSQKVQDLQTNPYVHILLGLSNNDASSPYIEYTGKLTDIKDDKLKLKWSTSFVICSIQIKAIWSRYKSNQFQLNTIQEMVLQRGI